MTTLLCSKKLLKRLRQPGKLPEPPPSNNPLGAWCADIDFINRNPYVVMMNTATGTVLVLPGLVADLKQLHVMAAQQLSALLEECGIDGPLAQGELDALGTPFAFAHNSNRSFIASMNQRKRLIWSQIAQNGLTAYEVALRELKTPFTRKDLPSDARYGFNVATDLLRKHLQPSAKILAFHTSSTAH